MEFVWSALFGQSGALDPQLAVGWYIAYAIASLALMDYQSKVKDSNYKVKGLNELDFPTVTEDRDIPYVAGDVLVKASNMTWYGNYRPRKLTESVRDGFFNKTTVTVGEEYRFGAQFALCWGVVDELVSLTMDDKVAWTGSVTTDTTFNVSNRGLFGGRKYGGGVHATCEFYRGTTTQGASAYLTSQRGGKAYNLRGLCHIVWRGPSAGKIEGASSGLNGEQTVIRPYHWRVRRWPNNLALGSNRHKIGTSANPAELMYELLTGRHIQLAGGGKVTPHLRDDELNTASFVSAGITFFNEGLGVSIQWNSSGSVMDLVEDLERLTSSKLVRNPETGLYDLVAMRAGYDVMTLPGYGPHNVADVVGGTYQALNSLINRMNGSYTDLTDFEQKPITVQSLGEMWMVRNEVKSDMDLSMLNDKAVATTRLQTEMKRLGSPLFSATLVCDRSAWKQKPTDVIRLNWPRRNIVDMACRVMAVDYSEFLDQVVKLSVVQDIYSIEAATAGTPDGSGWTEPSRSPAPVTTYKVQEMPVHILGANPPARLMLWAEPPNTFSNSADIQVSVNSAAYALAVEDAPLQYAGRLTQALPQSVSEVDTSSNLRISVDFDTSDFVLSPTAANIHTDWLNIIQIDDEILAVLGWSETATEVVVSSAYRGLFDTAPADHLSGAVVWKLSEAILLSAPEVPAGRSWAVKMQTAAPAGVLALASAPVTGSGTTAAAGTTRAELPYLPGVLRINGGGTTSFSGPAAWTWTHRSRLNYATDWYVGSSGTLEASATYTLRIYGDNDLALRTVTGLTTASYTYPEATELSDIQAAGGSADAGDVVISLRFGDADGSTTTVEDHGGSVTLQGSSTISTAQAVLTSSSLACAADAVSDAGLTLAANPLFAFGQKPFTVELWLRVTARPASGYAPVLDFRTAEPQVAGFLGLSASGNLTWFVNGATPRVTSAVLGNGAWHHIAIVRSGGFTTMWVNGASAGGFADANNYVAGGPVHVGRRFAFAVPGNFQGHIGPVRVVVGASAYVLPFQTPSLIWPVGDPQGPLRALQLHFDDAPGSTETFAVEGQRMAITNASISSAQSRFGGRSLLLNGTSGYAQFAGAADTCRFPGDFCVEGWFYPTSLAGTNGRTLCDFRLSSASASGFWVGLQNTTGYLGFYTNSTYTIIDTAAPSLNVWHHFAVTRSAGVVSLWLDGVLVGTTANATDFSDGWLTLGRSTASAASYYAGHLDEYRITKGAPVYAAPFTPPASAFQDISLPVDPHGTRVSCLLHGEGTEGAATMTDVKGNGFTATSAFTVAAQQRFGARSIYFSTTTSRVISASALDAFQVGGSGGSFTVEGWFRFSSVANTPTLWQSRVSTNQMLLLRLSGGLMELRGLNSGSLTLLTSTFAPVVDTWYHIAVSRPLGVAPLLFVDGVNFPLTGTFTYNTGGVPANFVLGTNMDSIIAANGFTGYMDDIRVTKGVGRYGGDFTPPDRAFLDGSAGALSSRLRLELETVRGSAVSLQRYNRTFSRV